MFSAIIRGAIAEAARARFPPWGGGPLRRVPDPPPHGARRGARSASKLSVGSVIQPAHGARSFPSEARTMALSKAQRILELKPLGLARPVDARTMNDLLAFTGWLGQHRPELLPSRRYGDPYQTLKCELTGLVTG